MESVERRKAYNPISRNTARKMESAAEVLRDLPKDFNYVFDVVHFIICIQGDREDMGDSFIPTTRKHPLASWMSSMLACFAGGILVSPLCGEPVLSAFDDGIKVLIATLLWFFINYTPQDLTYQVTKMFPVRFLLYLVKGLYYPICLGYKDVSCEVSPLPG
ncbi:trimeric intracellular cation channel type 1B.1 isoform X2 [Eurytemora carolleeae]|uniref:trimeric intracellular cation channel type 1B.1 isoform X2 n=1 Tax=Eurytemora carolleeae TaxID=1294199 RepID=UPI000C78434B|nr:trimeric intracellular cation channel type 1B.1 isoform X2 [Eurytemora carolleeae]|eukprot:XP_023343708.1 trimeric intracellular cation channel type 1B.1-like isoform X2 [Eurytemora affinis]